MKVSAQIIGGTGFSETAWIVSSIFPKKFFTPLEIMFIPFRYAQNIFGVLSTKPRKFLTEFINPTLPAL
jgi:hypothetical protein